MRNVADVVEALKIETQPEQADIIASLDSISQLFNELLAQGFIVWTSSDSGIQCAYAKNPDSKIEYLAKKNFSPNNATWFEVSANLSLGGEKISVLTSFTSHKSYGINIFLGNRLIARKEDLTEIYDRQVTDQNHGEAMSTALSAGESAIIIADHILKDFLNAKFDGLKTTKMSRLNFPQRSRVVWASTDQ